MALFVRLHLNKKYIPIQKNLSGSKSFNDKVQVGTGIDLEKWWNEHKEQRVCCRGPDTFVFFYLLVQAQTTYDNTSQFDGELNLYYLVLDCVVSIFSFDILDFCLKLLFIILAFRLFWFVILVHVIEIYYKSIYIYIHKQIFRYKYIIIHVSLL